MSTAQARHNPLIEPKPADDLRRVIACADSLLAQAREFVDRCRERFASPCAAMMNGTIGAHLRHNLDHFGAAIVAATDPSPIDYDHRARGTPVETDPDAALAVIDDLRARLASMRESVPDDAPVTVRMMLSSDGDEAWLRSTVARELAFAAHHALHHHAMMAAIAHAHGLGVPAGFGKAPSTLHHEANRGTKA